MKVPDNLTLDAFLSKGRQPGEEELDVEAAAAAVPEFNAAAMAQLEAMGFPTIRCQKALLATGNSDAEAAMNWLFAHMEDPGECFDVSADKKISMPLFSPLGEPPAPNHRRSRFQCSRTWASQPRKLAKP